jgi:hypothetical protein
MKENGSINRRFLQPITQRLLNFIYFLILFPFHIVFETTCNMRIPETYGFYC